MSRPLLNIIRSLNFQQDFRTGLIDIDPADWPALLAKTDRSHMTLALGVRCRDYLPQPVRERIDRDLASNALRHDRLFAEYGLIAGALQDRGIDFLLLKGFSHIPPYFSRELSHRPQYDIDLYCPPRFVPAAYDAMLCVGFSPIRERRTRTDHVPAMMRNTDWKWRGDYYDQDLPLTLELHFRFWDPQSERIRVTCVENFWQRRTTSSVRGIQIPMLSLADRVSYSALHLVRHLLRGDLRTYHVYELAHFLHYTSNDDELWGDWRASRDENGCIIEAVAFRLAGEWFGCKTHPIVTSAIETLSPPVVRWFELFAYSPASSEQPNKDELFLHLSLSTNIRDRLAILSRRLFPLRPPKLVEPLPLAGNPAPGVRIRTGLRQIGFFVRRAIHHARTTVTLLRSFARWRAASRKYAA